MTSASDTTTAPTRQRKPLTNTHLGFVVSDSRDKTRSVVVEYQVRHSKYGKYSIRRTRYHVHDEKNESRSGDQVEITPCRPLSKTKSWRLLRVVKTAAVPQA